MLRSSRAVISALFLSFMTACGGGSEEPPPHNETGKHEHTLMSEGMEREFIVYVPDLVANRIAPVVFMLHGTGGDGNKFFNQSGWKEKADQEGFIVVFPTALTYCYLEDENFDGTFDKFQESHILTKWDSDYIGDEAPLCAEEDIALLPPARYAQVAHQLNGIKSDITFLDLILDFIENNYEIDQSRIYATGFSNGGGMVSRMAVELSDRFAALASSAGPLRRMPEQAVRLHTFVMTLGNIDTPALEYFNFLHDPDISAFPLDESLLDISEFNGSIVDPMLTTLQLGNAYTYDLIQINGVDVGKFTFSDAQTGQGHEYIVLIIDSLTHQYPNGANHPMVMADYLWDVFKAETIN